MRGILENGAGAMGTKLSDNALDMLCRYGDFLAEENRKMNLTAITEDSQVAQLHFLDSLSLFKAADFAGARVIDIGSGAGFPGLPVKIACPSAELTLLDAQQKRVNFLSSLCASIGCQDVRCIHARAEESAAQPEMREQFDYAFARAVARLNVLCELCMPFVKVGGAFIAMKGRECNEELDEAKKAIKLFGGKVENIIDYEIPGTDVHHRLIVIKKVSNTPKAYPRRFAKIQKSPVL